MSFQHLSWKFVFRPRGDFRHVLFHQKSSYLVLLFGENYLCNGVISFCKVDRRAQPNTNNLHPFCKPFFCCSLSVSFFLNLAFYPLHYFFSKRFRYKNGLQLSLIKTDLICFHPNIIHCPFTMFPAQSCNESSKICDNFCKSHKCRLCDS